MTNSSLIRPIEKPTKRYSYSAAEKLKIIRYAEKTSQGQAAFKYGVHKSMISRWVRILDKIKAAKPTTRRIGSGRRPWKQCLEDEDEYNEDSSDEAEEKHIVDSPISDHSYALRKTPQDADFHEDDRDMFESNCDSSTLVAELMVSESLDGWESSSPALVTPVAISQDATPTPTDLVVAATTSTAFLSNCMLGYTIQPIQSHSFSYQSSMADTVSSHADTHSFDLCFPLQNTQASHTWSYKSAACPTIKAGSIHMQSVSSSCENMILDNTGLFDNFVDDGDTGIDSNPCRLALALDKMFSLSKSECM
ncbi:hypothetical protein BDV3_005891 [Batrachochytrium dendrobatidis]